LNAKRRRVAHHPPPPPFRQAAPQDQDVVADRVGEHIDPRPADHRVVAFAAIGGQRQAGQQPARRDRVVAALAVGDQAVARAEVQDPHLGGQPQHAHQAGAVADHHDGVVGADGVDHPRVGLAVIGPAKRTELDLHLGHVGAGQAVDGDRVGPVQAEHRELRGVRHRGRAGHGTAVQLDLAGRVAAGLDRVVLAVAEHRQMAEAGGKE
jgi:hypothetical protein